MTVDDLRDSFTPTLLDLNIVINCAQQAEAASLNQIRLAGVVERRDWCKQPAARKGLEQQ